MRCRLCISFGMLFLVSLLCRCGLSGANAQQAASISTCRTICSRSATIALDQSEQALLRQCVSIASCTTFSEPPRGAREDTPPVLPGAGGFPADIIRDPTKILRGFGF